MCAPSQVNKDLYEPMVTPYLSTGFSTKKRREKNMGLTSEMRILTSVVLIILFRAKDSPDYRPGGT